MRKSTSMLIVAVIATSTMTACGDGGGGADENQGISTSAPAATIKSNIGGTITIRHAHRSDKVAVTVNKVTPKTRFAESSKFHKNLPKERLYAVQVTFKNVSTEVIPLKSVSNHMQLVNASGRRLNAASSEGVEIAAGPVFKFNGELAPKGKQKGYIVFLGAAEAGAKKFQYKPTNYETGEWFIP